MKEKIIAGLAIAGLVLFGIQYLAHGVSDAATATFDTLTEVREAWHDFHSD
ncbi:hypothetical protein [Streptomyces sp. NBC_01481]|uniref:hypothetical protein n=1 Tax=Streptomyces sp. NBC_01481 TaxID=2975869 RepID=UPI00225A84E3|nr:hypothetical protein [Streptomyces sp. NBC_01481]MCX4583821.1 hypothetical protein [Streptomyces sp. NBC_01481]